MTAKLGLENSQLPRVQQESERINQERDKLFQCLQELKIFGFEITKIENSMPSFWLEVSTQKTAFERVLPWLSEIKQAYIPDEVWCQFQLAVGEVFDNVIKHAHKNFDAATPIEIEVIILSNYLVLRVWDRGKGFDLEKYLSELPEALDLMAESGRGFLILQQIADHISYTTTEQQKNCLLMIQSYQPRYI